MVGTTISHYRVLEKLGGRRECCVMKFRIPLFALCIACLVPVISMVAVQGTSAQNVAPPPPTRVENVRETLHGVEVIDRYRWLEDQNSGETRAWIEAQQKYTKEVLGARPGPALRSRLEQLVKTERVNLPPVARRAGAGRVFYMKRKPDQDLDVLYMREGRTGVEQVLIDPHSLSPDHSMSIEPVDVSHDGKFVLYGIREGGQDERVLRVFDVDARRVLPDALPRSRYFSGSISLANDAIFYCRQTAEGPRAYWHQIGDDPKNDAELFGKGYGIEKIIEAALSDDRRYLFCLVVHGAAADQTELFYRKVNSDGPLVRLVTGIPARFLPVFGDDTVFLQTNWKAPNGRILAVDLKNPAMEHWREVVPEDKQAIMQEPLGGAGGRLFVTYMRNAVSSMSVFDPDGKKLRDIPMPALGRILAVAGAWDEPDLFFSFTSFHMPRRIFHVEQASSKPALWFQPKIPIRGEDFVVKQVWASSKDGTRLPIFLLHKKSLRLDGNRPVLLYGYGGFNISQAPAYAPRAVALAEHDGIFAMALLRGGGEFGEKWHQAGMLANKQNVFDDFLAAAQWFIDNRYTRPERLAIDGVSNGGLLVGAAMTQRPAMFAAVVCRYPLLDMVRYHKFLVARYWVPEYGSSDDPEQFKYIHAYSPYHHVKPGTSYPAVLFVSGDFDTRVDPLHARKMTALLQAATGSGKPVLLHYDTKSGHVSAAQPAHKEIEENAVVLSFLFRQLGIP